MFHSIEIMRRKAFMRDPDSAAYNFKSLAAFFS